MVASPVVNMTIDELERLISNLTWEDFEKTDRGEFTVGYVPPNQSEPIFIKFYMRIGLHMNRPFQAVLADNQYVRLRAVPEYANHKLERLDAARPTTCLYSPRTIYPGNEGRPFWKPEESRESVSVTGHSYTTSYQAAQIRNPSPWRIY